MSAVADDAGASVLVGLVAFNEAASIGRVVTELRARHPSFPVAVVDDGSTDDTARVAAAAGAIVLRHPINLGVAAAESTLLLFACRRRFGLTVRMDGDGQHDPESLPSLIAAVRGGADLVVGSRFLGEPSFDSTGPRRAGIALLARLLGALTGRKVTDPTSGFRAFGPRAMALFSETMLHDYPEPESLLLARRRRLVVQEVPARMRPRTAGESSLRPLQAMLYMAKVFFALSLELLRPR